MTLNILYFHTSEHFLLFVFEADTLLTIWI